MKIYLDVCCLSRLTDDQSQPRIRAEAEAIERILFAIREGVVELIGGEALQEEVRRIPSLKLRLEVEALLSLATQTVDVEDNIADRAAEFRAAGYGVFDALHLATAEAANADVMLSTDDRLIRKASRGDAAPRIAVENPLSWSKKGEL